MFTLIYYVAQNNVISWNVRGLNSCVKRSLVFRFLKVSPRYRMPTGNSSPGRQTSLSLKKPWIAATYHAMHSSFSRRVSVLISKASKCQLSSTMIDPDGCFILLHMMIADDLVTTVNVYIPSHTSSELLTHIKFAVLSLQATPILFIADFNAVPDNTRDRLGGNW